MPNFPRLSKSLFLGALCMTLALGGALVMGYSPLTTEVSAVESPDCYCDLGQSTQTRWGLGSTCQASRDDLESQALADFYNDAATVCDAPCGFGPGEGCQPTLQITGSCTWNSGYGKFVTDGHINYGCLTCP